MKFLEIVGAIVLLIFCGGSFYLFYIIFQVRMFDALPEIKLDPTSAPTFSMQINKLHKDLSLWRAEALACEAFDRGSINNEEEVEILDRLAILSLEARRLRKNAGLL